MFRAYMPIFRSNGCYNFFTYVAYGVLGLVWLGRHVRWACKPETCRADRTQIFHCIKLVNYFILWVCFRSLSYPACNTHAPYCHLWLVRLYNIFPHLINRTKKKKRKRVNENKMCFDYLCNIFLKHFSLYVGESNENRKSAVRITYRYLRFSFDSPS